MSRETSARMSCALPALGVLVAVALAIAKALGATFSAWWIVGALLAPGMILAAALALLVLAVVIRGPR